MTEVSHAGRALNTMRLRRIVEFNAVKDMVVDATSKELNE